jgi:tripartite-type tricarboxylate transporter receptor subunit TctC
MKMIRTALLLPLLVLALALAATASAQTWPSKPVTMIVGYPAGSSVDTIARFLAEGMRERTGQPFVVENRPGGFGVIGAQQVARAARDGYTFLFAPASAAINVHLYRNLGYDPVNDLAPVTTVAATGYVLLVNPSVVPVDSVAQLTEYIRARPGKIAYGSGAAAAHIAAELYLSLAGLSATNVPYKGVPQALNDLLGGQIHFLFADATLGIPQARGGKVRALAVTTAQRTSAAPDILTMTEAGVRSYDLSGWFAVFLPAKSPPEIAQKFSDLANATMATDKAREFLKSVSADPFPGSPDSLARFLEGEIAKWGQLIKAARIEPE